jgi:transcriptional regulator with XRE-family HTH domain
VDADNNFMDSIDQTIARNVKHNRERAGLSQAELAAELTASGVPGMHQTTIARIESGQRVLRLAEAVALARFFEYQVEDLIESPRSAVMRSEYSALRKAVSEFHDAADNLNRARDLVSSYLDMEFPWLDDGSDPSVVTVDPRIFNMLDELWSTNSEPMMLMDSKYDEWLRNFRDRMEVELFTPSMEMYVELLFNGYEGGSIHDRTEDTDEEFRDEVLARFGDGS